MRAGTYPCPRYTFFIEFAAAVYFRSAKRRVGRIAFFGNSVAPAAAKIWALAAVFVDSKTNNAIRTLYVIAAYPRNAHGRGTCLKSFPICMLSVFSAGYTVFVCFIVNALGANGYAQCVFGDYAADAAFCAIFKTTAPRKLGPRGYNICAVAGAAAA